MHLKMSNSNGIVWRWKTRFHRPDLSSAQNGILEKYVGRQNGQSSQQRFKGRRVEQVTS